MSHCLLLGSWDARLCRVPCACVYCVGADCSCELCQPLLKAQLSSLLFAASWFIFASLHKREEFLEELLMGTIPVPVYLSGVAVLKGDY